MIDCNPVSSRLLIGKSFIDTLNIHSSFVLRKTSSDGADGPKNHITMFYDSLLSKTFRGKGFQ